MYVAKASVANTAATTAKGDRAASDPGASFAGILHGATAGKLDTPQNTSSRRDKPQDNTAHTQRKDAPETVPANSATAIAPTLIPTGTAPVPPWALPISSGPALNGPDGIEPARTLAPGSVSIAPLAGNDPLSTTPPVPLAEIPSSADAVTHAEASALGDPLHQALASPPQTEPELPPVPVDSIQTAAASAPQTDAARPAPESAQDRPDPPQPALGTPLRHRASDISAHTLTPTVSPNPTSPSTPLPSSNTTPQKSDSPRPNATVPDGTTPTPIPHPAAPTPAPSSRLPHDHQGDQPQPQRFLAAPNSATSAFTSASSSSSSDTASSDNGDEKSSRHTSGTDTITTALASTPSFIATTSTAPVAVMPTPASLPPASAGAGTTVPNSSPTPSDATGPASLLHPQVESHLQTTSLNTARLLQTAGSSEMRVGLRSEEFGNITIHTTFGREQISARISVDNGQLGSALSVHLPSMQEKLAQRFGLDASLALDGTTTANTSSGNQPGADHRSGQQSAPQTARDLETEPASRTAATSSDLYLPNVSAIASRSGRLDIRI